MATSQSKQNGNSKRMGNGQRRLAITLTLSSLAVSAWGAQLLAAGNPEELLEEVEAAPPEISPIREPYSLELQPIPTLVFSERDPAALEQSEIFSLALEPVPTVSAAQIEAPVTDSKSSKGNN